MVPHLGSRPAELRFPFVEANALLWGLGEAGGDLAGFAHGQGEAAAQARVGFEGSARGRFDAAVDNLACIVQLLLRLLHEDAGEVERLILRARLAIEAREDEIACWEQAVADYRAGQAV